MLCLLYSTEQGLIKKGGGGICPFPKDSIWLYLGTHTGTCVCHVPQASACVVIWYTWMWANSTTRKNLLETTLPANQGVDWLWAYKFCGYSVSLWVCHFLLQTNKEIPIIYVCWPTVSLPSLNRMCDLTVTPSPRSLFTQLGRVQVKWSRKKGLILTKRGSLFCFSQCRRCDGSCCTWADATRWNASFQRQKAFAVLQDGRCKRWAARSDTKAKAENPFVRDVKTSPDPAIVVCTESQLSDLERNKH